MAEFRMPSLGADMQSGTLVEWLKKPGDPVHHGDIIAIVGTEKGDIEVEVFEDGVLSEILVQEGQEVPVGTVLALIRGEGETEAPAKTEAPAQAPQPVAAAAEAGSSAVHGPPQPMPSRTNGHRVRVSPVARRLAEELGVDLSQVEGTGPGGAIGKADVERAAAAMKAPATPTPTPPPPPPVEERPAQPAPPPKPVQPTRKERAADFQASMRQAIARAMARSNRDIPHYYLQTRIDMTRALAWLEAENEKRSVRERLLPAVLLIKAVAKALTDVPALNGFWIDDQHQVSEAIHIGFAIALRQGGLVTPAIHNADLKSLDELREALADLIMRTRTGRLRSSELTDATITVTNLGDMGVETVYGVIYPPQVALVGLGKITEQPWAENGMIGVRKVLTATLAADHRATDGRVGAQFLEALNKHLQAPENL